jgi:ribosome recycling factor
MIKALMNETKTRMQKTLDAMEEDFKSIRTGRASPALVERVMVEYYGVPTPLNQLAVISAPEPQLLLIRPYDPSSIVAIEKGVLQADLGLNPSSDGRLIRIPIPRLTEERRRDLVKVVKRRMEESKIALRNIRRDALEELRLYESEKLISEDARKRGQHELQKTTNLITEEVENLGVRKEQDIMEI